MSDTRRRTDRPEHRGSRDFNDSRSEDRKRPWRSDNDSRDGREDRGFKQLKPGTMGMKVLVPNSLVGAIIGKGGEEMKKLKESSECFIRLSPNDKYFPNTNERPCYIEGEPENIIKAVEALQQKLANDNPRRGPSIDEQRKKQCKIVVGANAAGKCIGKGGENVKRLKSEFGVWIKVMGRDDAIPGLEERTVTISGEMDSTMKTVKDILDMALTLNNGGTDKNLDYDSFTGGSAAPQGGGTQGSFNQAAGGGYNQGSGGGFNNNQANFGNQYNNQLGGNMAPRSNSQGPPNSNMGGGFNNMGGGPNNMGGSNNMGGAGPNMGGPNNLGGSNNMGGGSYNPAPAQQYGGNQTSAAQQFGQPGQYQGNIQQYPNSSYPNAGQTNPTIPIQQYPGNAAPATGGGGYGNNPAGGYNSNPGSFNQGGGYSQAPGGNQGPTPGAGSYQNQGGYQGGNQGGFQGSQGPQGGFQGGNQGGFQGGQAPQSGFQGSQGSQGGFQGGNQGGFQGGNQGGNQGGFQGGRSGNQGGGFQGGRGNFNNNRGAGGRGAPGGGRGAPRGRSRFSDRN